jgi:indole-3-glycerol phosphate synthase
MSAKTGTYLDRILERTASDLIEHKQVYPHKEILRVLDVIPPALPFTKLLRQENVSVIAEFKRASPSKGVFPGKIEPATVADEYIRGGARAISCLTDVPFFKASQADLPEIVYRAHQATPPVGVLRKDFMIDPYQIDDARAQGVDCILLIVAALDDTQLRDFMEHATGLGMSALVEVHDESELERALNVGATLLGINNRDLRTFNVDLATTERLAAGLSSDITLVAESGVFTRADVERMARAGASAVLVGESLIVHRKRVVAVRELAGVTR